MLRGLLAGHIAHLLDADHGEPVCGLLRYPPKRPASRGFPTRTRLRAATPAALNSGSHAAEQTAEVTLIAEQFGSEVADVRDFDVLRLELRLGQCSTVWRIMSAISMPLRAQLSAKSV